MRRYRWLFVGAAFLLGGALWLAFTDPAPKPAERAEVKFPRHLTRAQAKRLEARRTLAPIAPATPADPGAPPAPPPTRRDPVLAALSMGKGMAMVVEANAIRHSPVGQLLVECLQQRQRSRDGFERVKRELGVDPLEAVDRIAFNGSNVIVSGHFAGAHWERLVQNASAARYGDHGTILSRSAPGAGPREAIGIWRDELMVVARDEGELRRVFDGLEGRAELPPPLFSEEQSYGDVYGVVSREFLDTLLGPARDDALVRRVKDMAENIELHVDTRSDVTMTARVKGRDQAEVGDVAKSLGGALSMLRLEAKAKGDEQLAELLDFARVRPVGDSFDLDLALPLEVVERQLAFCRASADAGR